MNRIIVCWIIVLLFLCHAVFSQRIHGTVEVVLDKLPMENQEKLAELADQLDRYINGFEWSPDDYKYEVPVSINVYFEEAKATSREDRYEARLIISNESDVQYSDYRWDFDLDPHPQLQHTQTYQPFTGMIEFYLYLILGFEFDRIEKLGGRDYFQKARDVLEQAKFSRFIRGWDRREDILVEVLSAENQPTREMKFYYYTGIYYFDFGEIEDAREYLVKALSYFSGLPEEAMNRFYSLNYYPMGEALKQLAMKNELELLMQLDKEQEHKDYYRVQWEAIGETHK